MKTSLTRILFVGFLFVLPARFKHKHWMCLTRRRNCSMKEYYLENYMAKNLYYFECVVESRFNPESRYRYAGSKYVRLLPLGFEKQDGEHIKNTHDAGYYWQAPK